MVKQWKKSLFCYTVDVDDGILMYHTESGLLAHSTRAKVIGEAFEGKEIKDLELLDRLIKDGFVIPVNKDEYSIAKLKYYDQIYDRTLSFIILPTEQCNFRCQYCYETFQKGKMKENVIKNIILFLKCNLTSYSRLSIEWFGGEPLLALDVIEHLSKEREGEI